ncbi:MAG: amidohydrolase [Lachnospiraceae bacterium]|nr:amidohydrolase [Lachnospiraceae bacterium]
MLIKDITILDGEFRMVEHTNVMIENGQFQYVGQESVNDNTGEIIDGRNRLMMPGFYNTHSHVPMTLTRGLGEGLSLSDWLTKKMFPFERKLTGEDCYYGALLGAMELIAGGCVSISDMYFHIMDIAQALDEAGMKANICHGLSASDPDVRPEELKGWKDMEKLWKQVKQREDDRIRVDVGLHAEYTSTDALVRAAVGFAKDQGLRIHTHISESQKEHEECKKRHGGQTPVQYFRSCGLFENPVLAAHCVWLEEEDLEIMAEHEAVISHCISSNLKLGSGIAPISRYLDRGLNVVIATDGAASNNNLNMMEEIHLAAMAGKGRFQDPTILAPEQVLKMATINGARAQGRLDCGVIKAGNRADFIILELDRPHLVPVHDLLSNLVYSAQSSDLYMTVIDGKPVYRNGEFLTIDRERVMYEAVRRVKQICGQLSGM